MSALYLTVQMFHFASKCSISLPNVSILGNYARAPAQNQGDKVPHEGGKRGEKEGERRERKGEEGRRGKGRRKGGGKKREGNLNTLNVW